MTRLERQGDDGRVVVGYDPDLATYYVETGPPPVDPDDPEEGLVVVRGRTEHDLPDIAGLVGALRGHGVTLTSAEHRVLATPPAAPRA